MVRKEDAVHVPDLPFVPVGRLVDLVGRVQGGHLVGVGLDADPSVVSQGQDVVDDLKTVFTGRHINTLKRY